MKFGLSAVAGTTRAAPHICQRRAIRSREKQHRTLQLERRALTRRDLRPRLAHARESQADLVPVAARDAVGEHVHVVAALEEVQRGLQDTDVRLRRERQGSA